MLNRLVHLLLAVTCSLLPIRSQDAETNVLRIEIVNPNDRPLAEYIAELEAMPHRQRLGPVKLSQDGSLRFSDVPSGDYRLAILDGRGALVYEQMIVVSRRSLPTIVRLPDEQVQHSPPGTVSILQLQHPVPQKAQRAFLASKKFMDAGDFERARVELKKALQISPYFAQALSNLTILDIRSGLYEQALAETVRAMEIAGPNARDLTNRALAEYSLERHADSMRSARSALHLDPNYHPAHYILGLVLARDSRTRAESVPHLEQASGTIPAARPILRAVQQALGHE